METTETTRDTTIPAPAPSHAARTPAEEAIAVGATLLAAGYTPEQHEPMVDVRDLLARFGARAIVECLRDATDAGPHDGEYTPLGMDLDHTSALLSQVLRALQGLQ